MKWTMYSKSEQQLDTYRICFNIVELLDYDEWSSARDPNSYKQWPHTRDYTSTKDTYRTLQCMLVSRNNLSQFFF